MSGTGRTVLRNAGALFVSQMITWSLTLALTIFLPRYLGAENVGRLILANSIWAVALVLVTFGMDVHLTKEVARRPERVRELLGTSFAVRAVIFVLGLAAVLAYTTVAAYPAETVTMIWIVAVASLFTLFGTGTQAVLQGVERMEYIALGTIIGKAVYSFGAIAMMLAGMDVYAVAAVAVAGSLVTLLVQLRLVTRVASAVGASGWKLRPTWPEARLMLTASVPYLLSEGFLVAYTQADIVVLSLLLDEQAVGWYGSARQLFGTLLFVPSIIVTALFPALSRLHATEPGALKQYLGRAFNALALMTIPIGLGLVVIANPLVVTLFGSGFANSGPILAVLGIVLILTSQTMLVGRSLIAIDRQRPWVAAQAAMGLATVLLDLVLIPWCQRVYGNGALGGALSYLVTESALIAVGITLLPRGVLTWGNASVVARGLLAGLAMAAAAWWLRDRFLLIPFAAGAVVYVVALWALRALPAEELRYAKDMAVSALGRLRGRRPQTAVAPRDL
jgi:O-antigen/teichoic acid export membrane protein